MDFFRKTETIQLQNTFQCHQPWQEMETHFSGKFCQQCEKTVFDFSNKSDKELAKFFIHKPKNVCGRVRQSQLNRPISYQEESAPEVSLVKWLAAGLTIGLPFLGQAQKQPLPTDSISQTHSSSSENSTPKELKESTSEQDSIKTNFVIKGIVQDAETMEPLPFSKITLSINGTEYLADVNGDFNIDIQENLIADSLKVKFECLGYKSLVLRVDSIPERINMTKRDFRYQVYNGVGVKIPRVDSNSCRTSQGVKQQDSAKSNFTVKGIVQDAETMEPLPFASVSISETKIGCLTDINGEFNLDIPDSIQSDSIQVIVSYIGYDRKSLWIDLPNQKEVNVTLNMIGNFLGEITVIEVKQKFWNRLRFRKH